MERVIIFSIVLILFGQCSNPEKRRKDESPLNEMPVAAKTQEEIGVTESIEIPKYLDSAIHRELKSASVFWILEDQVLGSWPVRLKGPIETVICKNETIGENCTPRNFNVVNLNDSLDLIVDKSFTRSGSAGTPYYIYNNASGRFLSVHTGSIYGVVKADGFIGFIYHFRYINEDYVYESYDCLEEIVGSQVRTRAIFTPNTFESIYEQRKHFESYKSKYVEYNIE